MLYSLPIQFLLPGTIFLFLCLNLLLRIFHTLAFLHFYQSTGFLGSYEYFLVQKSKCSRTWLLIQRETFLSGIFMCGIRFLLFSANENECKSLIITRIMLWNPQSGVVILFKKFLTENSYFLICKSIFELSKREALGRIF